MREIRYSDFEKIIETKIKQWAEANQVSGYDDEYSNFNYVDALTLASDITLEFYLEQGNEGIKIISDKGERP